MNTEELQLYRRAEAQAKADRAEAEFRRYVDAMIDDVIADHARRAAAGQKRTLEMN
ncbi:MAG TPA: hypothetical protein VFK05_25655 [Polyangiaceae bacterium]|nr:hypothetical protein [Polyangiaceae bacterium]